jgi:hypothetical protein
MVSIKELQNHGVLRSRRGLAVSWAPCVSDQVISRGDATAAGRRAPGPGLVCAFGRKASSNKLR